MTAFRVGEWTVEPELGRVRSPESEANLQPQVMQLLVYMARHPREVISIDRMIDEVWSGKPMTSGSVYNALNTLRKTFGDSKDQPRYIETIPRKGYRLIAEVVESNAGNDEPHVTTLESPEVRELPAPMSTRLLWGALAAAALIAFVLLSQKGGEVQRATGSIPPDKSIAVLPFTDMSPEGDQQYFAEGIAEEILNVIARHPDLKVVGRSSSFQFRDAVDLTDVGQKLGVAHVLEGSVRRDGDRLRITAQLIETAGGYHLWSESYDTEAGDIFGIQDTIAAQIADKLQLAVLGEEAETISAVREGLLEAIEYLRQALEIDPDYAKARVELAYAMMYAPRDRETFYAWMNPGGEIERQAKMALVLDPNLSGAYAIQATLHYQRAWNGAYLPESAQRAEELFGRALELNPNDAQALLWSSGLRRFQGQPEIEAIELTRRALELEPLMQFGHSYYLDIAADKPAFRTEVLELLEKISSGSFGWQEGVGNTRASVLWGLGQLADAARLMEDGEVHESITYRVLLSLGELEQILEEAAKATGTGLPVVSFVAILLGIEGMNHCATALDEGWKNTHTVQNCALNYLVAGRPTKAAEVLSELLPPSDDEYQLKYRHTFERWQSTEMTLATLAKMREDHAEMERRIESVEKFLEVFFSDERTHGYRSWSAYSLIQALRGDSVKAIELLGKALEWGQTDWRLFMHPAYDELRSDPRFAEILERWITRLNQERAQLGLPPRQLNPEVGPGALPFVLEPGELDTDSTQ
jgi:TolB-like protein/DNA-binding winged helix-turn-helix (wHTH) protein